MNFEHLAAFALFAALCGCQAATIDARADSKLADARSNAAHATVYARCADGSQIGPDCGLIMKLAASDTFRERFRAKVCTDKSDEACDAAFRQLIDAEMARRYFAANPGQVAQICGLHPGHCDDGVAYERVVLGSHNAHVQAKYEDDETRIQDERRAEHEVDREKTTGAVLEIATLVAGGSVCHSYPSAFGGIATVCSR